MLNVVKGRFDNVDDLVPFQGGYAAIRYRAPEGQAAPDGWRGDEPGVTPIGRNRGERSQRCRLEVSTDRGTLRVAMPKCDWLDPIGGDGSHEFWIKSDDQTKRFEIPAGRVASIFEESGMLVITVADDPTDKDTNRVLHLYPKGVAPKDWPVSHMYF